MDRINLEGREVYFLAQISRRSACLRHSVSALQNKPKHYVPADFELFLIPCLQSYMYLGPWSGLGGCGKFLTSVILVQTMSGSWEFWVFTSRPKSVYLTICSFNYCSLKVDSHNLNHDVRCQSGLNFEILYNGSSALLDCTTRQVPPWHIGVS